MGPRTETVAGIWTKPIKWRVTGTGRIEAVAGTDTTSIEGTVSGTCTGTVTWTAT